MDLRWFSFPVSEERVSTILERLRELKFVAKGSGAFEDPQGRQVVLNEQTVRVGIPKSDVVDEQEQLEYLAGLLELPVL